MALAKWLVCWLVWESDPVSDKGIWGEGLLREQWKRANYWSYFALLIFHSLVYRWFWNDRSDKTHSFFLMSNTIIQLEFGLRWSLLFLCNFIIWRRGPGFYFPGLRYFLRLWRLWSDLFVHRWVGYLWQYHSDALIGGSISITNLLLGWKFTFHRGRRLRVSCRRSLVSTANLSCSWYCQDCSKCDSVLRIRDFLLGSQVTITVWAHHYVIITTICLWVD